MPKLKNKVPSYRMHKATGQAVVTLDGRDIYLGAHSSATSREAYQAALNEWLASHSQRSSTGSRERDAAPSDGLTIDEIFLVCCLSRNWTFPDPGLACPGKGNDHEERTQEVLGRGEDGDSAAAPGGQGSGVGCV